MNVAMRSQKFLDARGLVGRGIVGDDVNFLAVGLVHDDVGEKRLGLGLYGAVFVVYAAALARLPFNVAHPVLTSGAVA
jgi:hypothetical protein